MLFRHRYQLSKKQQQQDPGLRLINRMLMFGLIGFLGYSVLTEKRALETTRTVWNISLVNNISGKTEETALRENAVLQLTLDHAEVEKLKASLPDAYGRYPAFQLRISQVVVKPEAPKPAVNNEVKTEVKPETNLPAEAAKPAPAPAKTVTP